MDLGSTLLQSEEKYEDTQKIFPGPAMKAELHQIPEILELIFSYLDIWTVRNFRFVNKLWNAEACNRCGKTTSVSVQQVDSQHEHFIQLLGTNRAFNLPLPFNSVTVFIDRWNNSILHEIVKDSRLFLHLKFFDTCESNPSLHHYRLSKLLGCSKLQRILSSLEFGSSRNSRIFLKSDSTFTFPNLKHLSIANAIGDTETLEFLIRIINHSNLQSLSLGSEIQRNYMVLLFERSNLTKIINFNFDISSAILPARDILPKLECMRVTMVPEASTENFTVPRQLVREFSHVLKELDIYWNSQELNVNLLGFPQCLHLSKLTIYNWGGHIGAFNFEKLPSLKEISLFQDVIASDNFAFTNVHPGVEVFKFNQGVLYPNDLILPSHFHRFLSHVAVQFPNLKSMYLTWHIGPETMQVILRKFSRLERLELNSKFGFHESVITGSGFGSVINVRNYWRNGFNWSCGDDNLTLASLTHLKHLRLEHGWNSAENPDYEFFPVTNRGIRDGISKIPALDTLRLTWTPKLSAAALGEYLKNVRTIMVDITTGTNYDSDTCLQLRLLWPQVKILRARHKCVNVSWMSKILGWVRSFLWLDE